MPAIDLNSDLGESYGAFVIGRDAELFPLITSANVACGFHGGDPLTLTKTVAACAAAGVAVGAHPGLADLVGFGRRTIAVTPAELRSDTLYQLGALEAICRDAGVRMQHVKPHGALSSMTQHEPALSEAIASAVKAFDPGLAVFAMPDSQLHKASEAAGLRVVREGYADRGYNADGSLVNRRLEGALITDGLIAARRVVRLVQEGFVETAAGSDMQLNVETICVHSDTPGSVEIMAAVRSALIVRGVTLSAPGRK